MPGPQAAAALASALENDPNMSCELKTRFASTICPNYYDGGSGSDAQLCLLAAKPWNIANIFCTHRVTLSEIVGQFRSFRA